MTFALIIDEERVATGNLPTAARNLTTGQWVTPPGGVWTPEAAAACGWYEVTETPRPEPVEGGVWESSVVLVDGTPTRVWEWRAWTVEELAAQADAVAQVDKIAAIEAAVLATVDRTPKPWHPVTGAHDAAPPLSEWTMDDGHTYRNVSGQWLSHSPYEYPRGYECLDCEPVADWAPWVQPIPGSGTNEPYAKDAKVTHKDQRYISNLDGNVWEPGVYGWTLAP